MLLTQDDIKELTGYKSAQKQSDWLAENRITHFVNGANKVQVTWQSVNNPTKKITQPDFRNVS
jgi:hypothetical protein|tara:strand:+ start:219 stop:407 length:189 start_codon:yes stop_codon:yes gene_type:complete